LNAETCTNRAVSVPPKVLMGQISQAYGRQARQRAEHEWIMAFLPLVRHVVRKVTSNIYCNMDIEDLISAGTLGLVKAAKAFDPSAKAEFKTYAYIRIKGAVIDELRKKSFAPAAMCSQIRLVKEAYNQCYATTGIPPADEELAKTAGLSVSQLYRTLEEARRQNVLSIHGLSEDSPAIGALVPADGAPSPLDQVERNDMLTRLAQAITELPTRDRQLILLYYERDLTMKEVAEVLELTESRVSQLHASALFKLSMKLRTES